MRPISEWVEEMLQDEDLIHQFVWDAERVSKFDSGSGSWMFLMNHGLQTAFGKYRWAHNCI